MPDPVLVVGATGQQGGSVLRALHKADFPVRALVRDPAKAAHLGVDLVTGDLRDRDSLAKAVDGVRAVFSMQMPEVRPDGTYDFAGELRQGENLVAAAREAGVPQFVHSSVSGSDRLAGAPGDWTPLKPYYDAKQGVEDRVREAGFESWTLIKPAFFMENFLLSAAYLLPRGAEGGIATVIRPDTHLSLIAVEDIGAAVAAAVARPRQFHRVELELAGDYLPMTEIAAILSRALGVPLTAPDMTEEEAVAAGMPPYAGLPMRLMNLVGQPARPEFAHALDIPMTTFERWAQENMR